MAFLGGPTRNARRVLAQLVGITATGELAEAQIDESTGRILVSSDASTSPDDYLATQGDVALSTTQNVLQFEDSFRTSITIKNLDSSITVRVGAFTDSAYGYPLGPGEVITFITTSRIDATAESGTPSINYFTVGR